MTPTKLTLAHFCQHEALEVVFARGMNNVSGPNGSGKSNLLDAIRLCLSLESGNPGKLADNIQDGHNRASINLEFSHNGLPGRISIELRRNYLKNWDEVSLEQETARARIRAREQDSSVEVTESQLKLAVLNPKEEMKVQLVYGDVTLTKVGEVREWIRNNVGLDPKVISDSYFPRQGDVDGVLSGDRETRQRVFHDKAGTAMCQRLWDELGKELRSLPDLTSTQDREQELGVKEAKLSAELAEWQEKCDALSATLPDVSGLAQKMEQHRISREHASRHHDMVQRRNELVAQANKAQQRCDDIKAQGVALAERVQAQAPRRSELAAALQAQNALREQLGARNLLLSRQTDIQTKLQQINPLAVAHPYPEGFRALVQACSEAERALAEAKHYVEHFSTGYCPTCKQEVAGASTLAQQSKDRLPELQKQVSRSSQAYDMAVKAAQAFETWHAQQVKDQTRLQAELASVQEQLSRTPAPTGLLDQQELSSAIQEHDRLTADANGVQRLREQYLSAEADLDTLKVRIRDLDPQIEAARQAMLGVLGQDELRAMNETITAHQAASQLLREYLTELEVKSRYLTDVRQDLESAKARSRAAEPQARWRSMLEQVRDLLHRDALPAEVVAWYADELVRHTMTYLNMFDAGFELFVANDLTLMGMFADKTMPVSRLSGGQKNMLNISMRLAMVDMFPSDLKVLILDEVEVHLDQHNVARLPVVLERVKGLARGHELVVLFVSHHPSLSGVADHVIHTRPAA